MRFLRAALFAIASSAPVIGCSLFSDLGGFHEDLPDPANDSAAPDATSPVEASANDVVAPAVDAGPDASPYKLAVLADQPMAYWPFDEEVGSNVAKDVIGGKNADVVGAVTFGVAGADGTAVERASGGGHLEVGDYFDLAGKTAYSIELWAWSKGTAQFEDLLAKRNQAQVGWWVYFRNETGTSIQIEQRYAAGSRTTYAPVPNAKTKLHHLVFVFDPAQATDVRQRVYIDSVRTDGFSDDGPADDNDVPLTFMLGFTGVLDEVALYDHALTATRVAEHFKLGPK